MKVFANKKKSGVFTLLLRNYIAFTLALILVLILLAATFIYRTFNYYVDVYPEQIKNNLEILASGNFEQFPTQNLLGNSGFIVVLDENGDTIYNESKVKINVTPDEIPYIHDYLKMENVTVEKLKSVSGDNGYKVQISYQEERGNSIARTYIFDENYHLLFCPKKTTFSDLTENQYKLLTQTYFKKYTVSKYSFQNLSNKNYTLLLFQTDELMNNAMLRSKMALNESVVLLAIIYCIMIFVFILWLKRKITKPLRLLCSNLNDFEVGTDKRPIYRGPREFDEIFESFTGMSERLLKSEEERKSLEFSKQKMLADIAHDLKTPITVVQGYAKAINDGIISTEDREKYLDIIEQKATSLNLLINTFYEYSKLEHPDYSLELKQSDICNYIRNYVAEKYTELETAGFKLEVDIPESHIICKIDEIQLKRAFENIITNSVKHNPKGVCLYIALAEEKEFVIITLADNGIGIPLGMEERIFESFEVGETSRSNHGSGLGLSITKKIVESHFGTVRITQNISGYKTEFEIKLPRAKIECTKKKEHAEGIKYKKP